MIDLILHVLLLAVVIYALADTLEGMYVENYGTAVGVAIVYGIINVTLGSVLKLLGLPFIIITVGVFLFFINAFLLWLTDALMDSFEIEDAGTTIMAAVVITLADTLLDFVF